MRCIEVQAVVRKRLTYFYNIIGYKVLVLKVFKICGNEIYFLWGCNISFCSAKCQFVEMKCTEMQKHTCNIPKDGHYDINTRYLNIP